MRRAKPGDSSAFLKNFQNSVLKEAPLAGAADRNGHTLAARWPQEHPLKPKPQNSTSPTYRRRAGPPLFETRQKQPFNFCFSVLISPPPTPFLIVFSLFMESKSAAVIRSRSPTQLTVGCQAASQIPQSFRPTQSPLFSLINTALFFCLVRMARANVERAYICINARVPYNVDLTPWTKCFFPRMLGRKMAAMMRAVTSASRNGRRTAFEPFDHYNIV